MVPADPNSAAPLPSGGSDPRTRAAPTAAPRIREYELLEQIGQGGMGTVFKASHTMLERMVAIKLLPRERMHHAESVARFRREMKAVGKLVHPNIVQAHDAGEEAGVHFGVHFLVMEYVDGVDVSRVQKRCGPLRVADACEIIRQAAVGLQHAHEHRMVHRDIKPSNLLLCRTDAHVRPPSSNITAQDPSQRSDEGVQTTVKLLDLGLALLHEGDASLARNLTDTGQVMGTLDYMAPEQADDTHAVDIRADIYSLGCTLYSLLAGEPPFAGPQFTTAVKKLAAHMQKPFPPLADRRDDIPIELQAILERMVAKSPADRFVTPGEVAAAIKPLTTGHDLAALLGRATQGKSPTPSGSVHETFAYLSSAFTATQPSPPSNQLAPTIDKLAATETLHSTPRRHVPKLGLFAAVGLIVLLVVYAVFMQSGKQAPPDESKVASTLRRAEPSPPSADPQSTLDSNSSSSPEGSSRRSVTATLPDSSTPALDPPLSTLDFPEPPPFEEWLQGREILTVKQDGSAMFTKIQDALDALKPGQAIELLDRGPYDEAIDMRNAPGSTNGNFDSGVISQVGTVVSIRQWIENIGHVPVVGGRQYFGWRIGRGKLRISGIMFRCEQIPEDSTDIQILNIASQSQLIFTGNRVAFALPSNVRRRLFEQKVNCATLVADRPGRLAVCDNWLGAEVRIYRNTLLEGSEVNVSIHRNLFTSAREALCIAPQTGKFAFQENIIVTSSSPILLERRSNNYGDNLERMDLTIVSNSFLTDEPILVRTAEEGLDAVDLPRKVAIRLNAFFAKGNTGILKFGDADDRNIATRIWKIQQNAYPMIKENANTFPRQQQDVILSDFDLLSTDTNSTDWLRPRHTSALVLSVPEGAERSYIGALPPGPAPPEGDWFTRLLDRWKEAQEDLKRMGLEK